ncbi:MAG: Ycf66 family protein [Pleurocapsa sp.]
MVNFGLNAAAILGLFLAVAGAGLFFLRSIRPELARDYDIFFAAVGLLCGIILLFNGWRLDPILQFGQFLLTGTAIFFAFESIRMRGVATEQARRNTPTVDRDRTVSRTRVYTEAEFDQIDPYDDVYEGAKPNYNSPRLRGYDEPNPRSSRRPDTRRRPSPATDIRDEPRRTASRNRPEPQDYAERTNKNDRYPERDSRPRRRPSPPQVDDYSSRVSRDEWADTPRTSPRSRPRPTRDDVYSNPTPPATARRRPSPADLGRSYEPEDSYDGDDRYDSDNLGSSYDDAGMGRGYEEDEAPIPGDYVVDYQPLDDAGSDYSDDYDDSPQDDYDNYDNRGDNNPGDDYRDRPDTRTPINFDK